ncbi:hypothetical protein NKH28_33385 [Mesorhizobium sp. M1227]|uniref:hypothetical protein n=1 Tax=unclassified Mesorhizobium TaxID=325217 RepID=UPI00333512AB
MVEAARSAGVQVIWDIFHCGSPDHVDQRSLHFIDAYASFAAEAVSVQRSIAGTPPLLCPID